MRHAEVLEMGYASLARTMGNLPAPTDRARVHFFLVSLEHRFRLIQNRGAFDVVQFIVPVDDPQRVECQLALRNIVMLPSEPAAQPSNRRVLTAFRQHCTRLTRPMHTITECDVDASLL
jgi:hypothetical protein